MKCQVSFSLKNTKSKNIIMSSATVGISVLSFNVSRIYYASYLIISEFIVEVFPL